MNIAFSPNQNRYDSMIYNRCGKSGLLLPSISLGLWHNFGGVDSFENGRSILRKAFDQGITHFDLANNYGPPYGSAEENFGKYLKLDFKCFRDELIISSKAGCDMWAGPYGDWGSRKYLIASCNQSLDRMGLEYVDIFYHHRPDPNTPLEETMGALDQIVKSGKALYTGVSNYPPQLLRQAYKILKDLKTPFIVHQPRYNMLDRHVEEKLLDTLEELKIGCIVFSPLAQGLLTNKYLKEIPIESRAAKTHGHLQKDAISHGLRKKLVKLNHFAEQRSQTLAQMAIAWLMRHKQVTSVLIGASSVSQLDDSLHSLKNSSFTREELNIIEEILKE